MAWISLGKTALFPERSPKVFQVEKEAVTLFKDGEKIFAFSDFCPHRGGPLSEGEFKENSVTCPWHCARFDLRTGECQSTPTHRRLRIFSARMEKDEILVLVEKLNP